MQPKYNETTIIKALGSKYPIYNYTLIPNIYLFGWEMDLIVITKNNYVWEFEIKTSIADLKADAKKLKWDGYKMHHRFQKYIKRFYYVIPEYLYPEYNESFLHPEIKEKAGLLTIHFYKNRYYIRQKKKSFQNSKCIPLKDIHFKKINTSIYFKMWKLIRNIK